MKFLEQRRGADEGLFNSISFPSVDDGIVPNMMTDQHLQWQNHVQQGYLWKPYLCKGCILAEGPWRQHCTQPLPVIHTFHIDVAGAAGPYTEATQSFQYFLVGTLRMASCPILLQTKIAATPDLSILWFDCHRSSCQPQGRAISGGKTIEGRLLFWNHVHDMSSFCLSPRIQKMIFTSFVPRLLHLRRLSHPKFLQSRRRILNLQRRYLRQIY